MLDHTADAATTPSIIQEHEGTEALLFKDNLQFWFETVRLFGAGDYGGALFGEVVAIANRINSGDYDSWCDAYSAFADRLVEEADGQARKGHRIAGLM